MTAGGAPEIRVSWIVVSHESAPDLEIFLPTLTPVLEDLERRGIGAELIVVDNASTDASTAVVERLAPQATLIRSQDNVGYGQAINLAARRARGAWLAIGNADLQIPLHGLDELVAVLDRQPAEVALVGPSILDAQGVKTASVGSFPTLRRLLTGLFRPCEQRKYVGIAEHVAGRVDWVTGACVFLRRDALATVEGFDEAFFLYYEDVDLACRLHERGLRRVYAPELEVLHLRPHHHRPPQKQIEEYVRASRRAYFARHRPRWESWLLAWLCRFEPLMRPSHDGLPARSSRPLSPTLRPLPRAPLPTLDGDSANGEPVPDRLGSHRPGAARHASREGVTDGAHGTPRNGHAAPAFQPVSVSRNGTASPSLEHAVNGGRSAAHARGESSS